MSSAGVFNVEELSPVEGGVVYLCQLSMISIHEGFLMMNRRRRRRMILTVCVSLILALVLSSHVGEVRFETSSETLIHHYIHWPLN